MKKTLLAIFIVSIALIVQVNAQTEISPEKKAAIKELTALISANNDVNQLINIISTQTDSMQERLIDATLSERTDLSEEDKKMIREMVISKLNENSKTFRERFFQKINFNEILDDISITVYDKYYTLDELHDILKFYKSPTGQKMLKTMTPLFAETMRLTQERLLPKLELVLKEMEQQEKAEIEKQIDARKPRTKKTPSK